MSKSKQFLQRAQETQQERRVETESDKESLMHQTKTKVLKHHHVNEGQFIPSPPIQNV
jgi:hypothetical protein